jgi:hypothetical protein
LDQASRALLFGRGLTGCWLKGGTRFWVGGRALVYRPPSSTREPPGDKHQGLSTAINFRNFVAEIASVASSSMIRSTL